MALTLPAPLLAAQTAKKRKPIIKITAGRLTSDFPLPGNSIANPDTKEQGVSSSIFLADGRYAIFYAGHDAAGDDGLEQLRMIITNTEVTEFNDYVAVYTDTTGSQISYIDTLLIGDGIGLVVQLGSDRLLLLTVSDTGEILSSTTLTDLATLYGAAIVATDSGYGLVYVQESGGTHYIYRRTSTDLISWAVAAAVTIAGLDSTHPLQHPRLIRLTDGSYLLVYSYATVVSETTIVYNLHYATSGDLLTWSASAAVTDDDTVSTDYIAPDVVQKPDGSLIIACQQSSTYLELRTSSSGWETTEDIGPTNVWIDSATGQAYLTSVYSGTGTKKCHGSCQIDIDTWSIVSFTAADTIPAIPDPLADTHCLMVEYNLGEGPLASLHSTRCAAVIDHAADSVRGFYLQDFLADGDYPQNVDVSQLEAYFGTRWSGAACLASFVQDNKLWLVLNYDYSTLWSQVAVGYIDLSADTAPFTLELRGGATTNGYAQMLTPAAFDLNSDRQLAVVGGVCVGNFDGGALVVLDLETKGLIKNYNITDYPDYPYAGVRQVKLIDDTIWAVPNYDGTYSPASDEHKWGLMSIDLNSDTITYYQPQWQSTPNVYLGRITVDEATTELFFRTANGVAVFNYSTKTFEQLENTVQEGLPPTDAGPYGWAGGLAYDPVRRVFIYGSMDHVYLVPREGTVDTLQYITDSGDFGFSTPARLSSNYVSETPSLALTGDVIYCSWSDTSDTPTVQWDSTAARIDLGPYLLGEVVTDKEFFQSPTLNFSVSHGHLFDPENDNSLLRDKLSIGAGVELQFGGKVDGVEYLVPQGVFSVASAVTSYKVNDYPAMRVECDTPMAMWEDHQITVVDVADQPPETAIAQIVQAHTSYTDETIDIPAMPLGFAFSATWCDAYLLDVLNTIVDRFQHVLTLDVNNRVTALPVNFDAVSSNYHSRGNLISWGSSNASSDYLNSVTVTGVSLTDFQVQHEEERLGEIHGSQGWWEGNAVHTFYYSEDQQKTAKNPRIEVGNSITSMGFELAGGVSEGITEVDPYNKYCVVTVEVPSLVPLLLSAIAMYAAGNAIGDVAPPMGGLTTTLGRKLEGAGLLLALSVLGSVANYEYEIYGNPIGYCSRTYSATVTNDELQQKLGQEVNNKFEGFACHAQAHCQQIGQYSIDVSNAKRRAVEITKSAHLQDEMGDTVTVEHLYSGVPKTMLLYGLRRAYKPATAAGDDGYFLDTLKGWVR